MLTPMDCKFPLLSAPFLLEYNLDILHRQPNCRTAIFNNDPDGWLPHRCLSPSEVMKLLPQSPTFASTKSTQRWWRSSREASRPILNLRSLRWSHGGPSAWESTSTLAAGTLMPAVTVDRSLNWSKATCCACIAVC
uniref:Uncharacterized protein n=1 Tax=Arundo donax TaxID=35708 RepID=A0A0A9CCI8_ARUDO